MISSPAKRLTGFSLLALLLIGLGLWGLSRSSIRPQAKQQAPAIPAGGSAHSSAKAPGPTSRDPAARASDENESAALDEHFAALSGATTPEEARRLLDELRTWLKELPPELAAAIISDFVQSGKDADLPLAFRIGDGGFLDSPPSFRVALLDYLGWLNPAAAVTLGREILSSPTSADEWAVSLRNVARLEHDDASNDYLRGKTEELVRNETWQEKPSVGFLNAFDVFVHTRAVKSTPLLSELIQRKDRRDLAHAGFLTLDRLTQREPVAMLARLREDRALQQSRPEMVAQQFARADLRNASQRELVQSWLLDPARTEVELNAFSGIFPNNNQMISRNLLTSDPQISGEDLREHDRAALILVSEWQQDPAYEHLRPHLATMGRRLQQFASPAPAGP